jgi:hypothetical protein
MGSSRGTTEHQGTCYQCPQTDVLPMSLIIQLIGSHIGDVQTEQQIPIASAQKPDATRRRDSGRCPSIGTLVSRHVPHPAPKFSCWHADSGERDARSTRALDSRNALNCLAA